MSGELLDLFDMSRDISTASWESVYVDIDVKYELFTQSRTYRFMMRNLYRMTHQWEIIKAAWYRQSSGGNVHIRVDTRFPVSFTTMMIIRAMMHDDIYRLAIDLRRMAYQGKDEVNRIFVSKIKDGMVASVGQWMPLVIHYVPEDKDETGDMR